MRSYLVSEQEQEHRDHVAGCASEAQNCFAEAGMRRRELEAENAEKIAKHVEAGLVVVAERLPYYCKATDALEGFYLVFRASFPSRAQADHHAGRLNDEAIAAGDWECQIVVLPELPAVRSEEPASIAAEDEIPF